MAVWFLAIVGGVIEIEIALVGSFILCDSKALAKSLIMHDLTGAEESDDVFDVWVIGKAEDIVVGEARFLFGG